MYLFVPCDKKSHGTEISFPIHSNHLSHPHPLEDAQASNTPQPMSFKNQIADSFHAFSVCIMDHFYNSVSLLKGGITKHKMDKENIGKRQI